MRELIDIMNQKTVLNESAEGIEFLSEEAMAELLVENRRGGWKAALAAIAVAVGATTIVAALNEMGFMDGAAEAEDEYSQGRTDFGPPQSQDYDPYADGHRQDF